MNVATHEIPHALFALHTVLL